MCVGGIYTGVKVLTYQGKKRVLDSLELELQAVLSCLTRVMGTKL